MPTVFMHDGTELDLDNEKEGLNTIHHESLKHPDHDYELFQGLDVPSVIIRDGIEYHMMINPLRTYKLNNIHLGFHYDIGKWQAVSPDGRVLEEFDLTHLPAAIEWVRNTHDFVAVHTYDDLERAEWLARRYHDGQEYRPGVSYIDGHIKPIVDQCLTRDQKILGWIHDLVEDTDVTIEMLEHYGFPRHILLAEDAISHRKNDGESYADYITRVSHDELATSVKCVDILWNIQQIPYNPKKIKLIDRYTKALIHLISVQALKMMPSIQQQYPLPDIT